MRIYGINPVTEALRAKRVTAIRVSPRADDRLTAIVRMAGAQGIPVRRAKGDELDRFAKGGVHQGVVADLEESASLSVEDLVMGASEAPLIVVLDQVEDPHNVGAILRTADAAGCDGVVRQSRHAARLEGTGLRRLVRDRCDWLASIPLAGHVQSLNVSVAAGVALFEARRQRRLKGVQ